MKTDVQISAEAAKPVGGERTLQRFAFEPQAKGAKHVSLNEADDQKPYDQFLGKKSSYRDDIYTTKLDHSKITTETMQYAERKEREILTQDSKGNVHLAEER